MHAPFIVRGILSAVRGSYSCRVALNRQRAARPGSQRTAAPRRDAGMAPCAGFRAVFTCAERIAVVARGFATITRQYGAPTQPWPRPHRAASPWLAAKTRVLLRKSCSMTVGAAARRIAGQECAASGDHGITIILRCPERGGNSPSPQDPPGPVPSTVGNKVVPPRQFLGNA